MGVVAVVVAAAGCCMLLLLLGVAGFVGCRIIKAARQTNATGEPEPPGRSLLCLGPCLMRRASYSATLEAK